MDRNFALSTCLPPCGVALRKESVDRNMVGPPRYQFSAVALRKESVDRNAVAMRLAIAADVALRKESVDRNQ